SLADELEVNSEAGSVDSSDGYATPVSSNTEAGSVSSNSITEASSDSSTRGNVRMRTLQDLYEVTKAEAEN
ncbi:hypothetical protein Droror1_Dr00026575, partial [Drosera rotundifolia]